MNFRQNRVWSLVCHCLGVALHSVIAASRGILRYLSASLWRSVVAVVLAGIGMLLYLDLRDDKYLIDLIDMPASIAGQVSSAAMSRKILDDLVLVRQQARTSFKADSRVEPTWDQVDFSLKGGSIEVTWRTLGDVFRRFIDRPRRRISGEVLQVSNDRMTLQIRFHVSGAPSVECSEKGVIKSETQNQSTTSHDTGSLECAEKIYEAISPYIAAAYYFQNKRWKESERMVLQVLRSKSADDRKWGYNLQGQLSIKKGDEKRALEQYEEALHIDPKFSPPWVNKGNISRGKKDYKEAELRYRTAIRLQESAIATNNLAEVLELQGRPDEAATLYKKAIDSDPKLSLPYSGLGAVALRKGDLETAEIWFEHAAQLASSKAEPLMRAAKVFIDLGKYPAAEVRLRQATTWDNGNSSAWSALAACLALEKKYGEAKDAAIMSLPDLFVPYAKAGTLQKMYLALFMADAILDPYETTEKLERVKLFLLIESASGKRKATATIKPPGKRLY